MKKSIVSFFIIVALIICCIPNAIAAQVPEENNPNASLYLSSYSVDLVAIGSGQMAVEMSVNATGTMTKLGVVTLYIEQKINGEWQEYDTVYGMYHSDFYVYNHYSYLGEYIFDGVAGRQYRATITAYARNSSGSDTGTVTSLAVTCRNP